MFREALVPENVDGLLPVHINEILYQHLPFKARVNDQCLRGVNTYFTRGLAPLVSVLDEIVLLTKCKGLLHPYLDNKFHFF